MTIVSSRSSACWYAAVVLWCAAVVAIPNNTFADFPQHFSVRRIVVPESPPGVEPAGPVTLNQRGVMLGSAFIQADWTIAESYQWQNPSNPRILSRLPDGTPIQPVAVNNSGLLAGTIPFGMGTPTMPTEAFVGIPFGHRHRYRKLYPPRDVQIPVGNDSLSVSAQGIDRFGTVTGEMIGQYLDASFPLGIRIDKRLLEWSPPFFQPREIRGTEGRCGEHWATTDRQHIVKLRRTPLGQGETCYLAESYYALLSPNRLQEIPNPTAVTNAPLWSYVSSDGKVVGSVLPFPNPGQIPVFERGVARMLTLDTNIPYQNYFPRGVNKHGIVLLRAYREIYQPEDGIYLVDFETGRSVNINTLIDEPFDFSQSSFPITINDANEIILWGTRNGVQGAWYLTPRRR